VRDITQWLKKLTSFTYYMTSIFLILFFIPPMKALKIFVFILFCGSLFSCSKSNNVGSPTMSASINGGSIITFSASQTDNNGQLIMQGVGNGYTVQLHINLTGSGVYTLTDPSAGSYATVQTGSGIYITTVTATGQATLSAIGTTGYYNGTFYFAALDNGNSIVLSNGQFTNM
jgi:hypothetical protein